MDVNKHMWVDANERVQRSRMHADADLHIAAFIQGEVSLEMAPHALPPRRRHMNAPKHTYAHLSVNG